MGMNELLLSGYECLTVILPFFVVFAVFGVIYRHEKISMPREKICLLIVFSFYIFFAFSLTGTGTLFDLQRYGIQLNDNQINLLPFSKGIDIIECFLNVLLFIPFGFIFPLIWHSMSKLKCVVLAGFNFSLLIEASQLFNNRRTDIDDLLLNTLGTLIGFLLFKAFSRIIKRNPYPIIYYKCEPLIYILTAFLGHFLMFNEFGLAKILYGF